MTTLAGGGAPQTTDDLVVRRVVATDLPAALALTQAQNWSHRLHDWELHFRLARGWAVADAGGTLLGTALWWPYGSAFGTVGLVVVRPDAQGRGIGRRLMTSVLEDAGPRALRLAATDAGLELYRRLGFVAVGGIVQRQGDPVPELPPPAPSGAELRDWTRADVERLVELDARAIGAPRRELLHALADVATGGAVALRAGEIVGYALQRAAGRGTTIGPVIAPDEAVACELVARLLQRRPGYTRLDVPTSAAAVGAFLQHCGLPVVDAVTPMVRGTPPLTGAGVHAYALASQALN